MKSKQLTFKIIHTFAQIVKTAPVQLEQYLYTNNEYITVCVIFMEYNNNNNNIIIIIIVTIIIIIIIIIAAAQCFLIVANNLFGFYVRK